MQSNDLVLPWDDLPKFVDTLKLTYSGNTESIKVATTILSNMSLAQGKFCDLVTKVVASEGQTDEDLRIKNAAIITMSRCFLEQVKSKKLPDDMKSYIIQSSLALMYSNQVLFTMKANIQYFLMLFYAEEKNQQRLNDTFLLLKEKLSDSDINNYPPSFQIFQVVLQSVQAKQEDVVAWFEEFRPQLIQIGGLLVQNLLQECNNFPSISEEEEKTKKLSEISAGLKMFQLWVMVIYCFTKRLSKSALVQGSSNSFLKVLVTNDKIAEILAGGMMINIVAGDQLENCFISTYGNPVFDAVLSEVKTDIIKLLNKVDDCFKDLLVVCDRTENKFYLLCTQYLTPMFLETIITFFQTLAENIENAFQSRPYVDLITGCLMFLTKMANHPELTPIFLKIAQSLIIDVCFTLLRLTKNEASLFKENSQQFVQLAMDVCAPQASEVPKAQAGKLLLQLCSSVDGVLSYVSMVAFTMIYYSIESDNITMIPENFPKLVDCVNSLMITKTEWQVRVETCLTVLAIIATFATQRKDIVKSLEDLLRQEKKYFTGDDSDDLIKSRVCLLLAYSSNTFFREPLDQDLALEYFKFIMKCSSLEGEDHQALVEQANTTLQTILEREFLNSSFSALSVDIIEGLTANVTHTKVMHTFEIILEIVASEVIQISERPDVLVNLMIAVVKRMQMEIELARKSPDKKETEWICKRLALIIMKVSAYDEYMIQPLLHNLEGVLEGLLDYIETNEGNDMNLFIESVCEFVQSSTKMTRQVSEFGWKLFKYFPFIFEHRGNMLTNFFEALNMMIVYGQETINSDPEAIAILIKMAVAALVPSNPVADESQISEGALLLQLILQYLSPISEEQFRDIISSVYSRSANADNDFLQARLGNVFMCAFMKDFTLTQNILDSLFQDSLTNVMNSFIREVAKFEENPYDRKVYIIGMCQILSQTNPNDKIKEYMPQIFGTLVPLLQYIKRLEIIHAKKGKEDTDSEEGEDPEDKRNSNKKLLLKYLDPETYAKIQPAGDQKTNKKKGLPGDSDEDLLETDSEEEFDEDDYIIGKSEAAEIVKCLDTDMKKKDEFSIFREVVLNLKDTRIEFLEYLVNSLSPQNKKFLEEIMYSKRVDASDGKSQARKIVATRRRKVANIEYVDGEFVKKKDN